MFRIHEASLGSALLAAIALGLPAQANAQRSGVEVWSANCGRCHIIQPAVRYSQKGWDDISMHMAITARLTSAEERAVTGFLKSGAQPVASSEVDGGTARVAAAAPALAGAAEIYARQCAACHGSTGDGKGPAAAAFNPEPMDFTAPNALVNLSDDDLVKSITNGIRAMPAFGAVLSLDEVKALAAYLRTLSAKPASAGDATAALAASVPEPGRTPK
jgi:mono/diheme cytochrome c family protein